MNTAVEKNGEKSQRTSSAV
uniref:Uncharacterized protein n=1 Tax=Anguilla anguilla TaxID=7936 RepID=A0A0E9RN01_ANGAN